MCLHCPSRYTHAHKRQSKAKSRPKSCRLRRRRGGAILTRAQTNRAWTLALVPPPCLFVLFFPQGAPPALGQLWKSCRQWCSRAESVSQGGGSGCRPEISNRHAESKTGGTGPRTAARRRGRALPAANTLSINMLSGQIWFHSGMCVTVAQSTRIRLGTARLLIHLLQKCWFGAVTVSVAPCSAAEGTDLFTAFDAHTSFEAFTVDF